MNFAICDDFLDIIGGIEAIIESCFSEQQDFTYESFLQAEELLDKVEHGSGIYQIYFLDVELPGMNGIELAGRIRKLYPGAVIIFITNHHELMADAFDVNAFHYLVKPLERDKVRQVILRAVQLLRDGKKVFQYRVRRTVCSVFYDQIQFLESDRRKVIIHTASGTQEFYQTLSGVWAQLDPLLFVQVHKSYIVNMNYICSMKRESIVMYGGKEILITKKYHQSFNEAYNRFILMRTLI